MNKKTLLISGLSFLAGGGVGFFVTNHLLRKEYKNMAEEAIEEARQHYLSKLWTADGVIMDEDEIPEDVVYMDEEANSVPSEDQECKDYIPKARNVVPVSTAEEVQATLSENSQKLYDPKTDGFPEEIMKPQEITAESFGTDFLDYEKESLYYYSIDGILVDSNEEIVVDREDVVGPNMLDDWRGETVKWVRSYETETDFEIIWVEAEFADQVHGYR